MRWIKTCIRKKPRTYTVIKAPSEIDDEFIEWVNTNNPEVHLEIDVDTEECLVDSMVAYEPYSEILYPNAYLVIDDYNGDFSIFTKEENLWNYYEEFQN